jgi:glycine cleavage system H protein
MLEILSTVAVFLVGLIARAALAILVLAAIVVPIAAAVAGWSWLVALADRIAGLRRVGHLAWRNGCYYTPGHLWLRPDGAGTLRVGLDDLGQRLLAHVGGVSLAPAGTAVRQGERLGTIRCGEGEVLLRAPVSGTIAAVNGRLERTPSLLHHDPYRRAWMVDIRPDGDDYRALPMGERARAWFAREDARLTEFFERRLGVAAADGGELILPAHNILTPDDWQRLMAEFLTERPEKL